MPSVRCGGCAKFLSPLEAAKCSQCTALYHRACGAVSPKGRITSSWVCPECKKKLVRGKEDPVQDEDHSSEEFLDTSALSNGSADVTEKTAIHTMLKSFKEELHMDLRKMMKEELSGMRHEFQTQFQRLRDDLVMLQTDRDKLRESVNSCIEKIDSMDIRLRALEQKQTVTSGGCDGVAQLRAELNDREQQLLSNDVEISSLPECNGENLIHTVKLIGNQLGVQIEERDIVCADRIGSKRVNATEPTGAMDNRPRPVVVRLARRSLRNEIIHSARVRRGTNTSNIGMPGPPKRFYINERLTKLNRLLFRRARDAGQRLGWKYVWTRHGRILARNKPGDQVCVIHNEEDLFRIFGTNFEKVPQA